MLMHWQLKLLACPVCKELLIQRRKALYCKNCNHQYRFNSNFPVLIPSLTPDMQLTMAKWDEHYAHKLKTKEYLKDLKDYQLNHQPNIVSQLNPLYKPKTGKIYLEIGSGPAYLSLHYGGLGMTVIGIDISINALKIAEKLCQRYKVKNYFFVCGDITQMPFKSSTIDFSYGGGVIEHFRNTQRVVDEIHRVLKPDGFTYNSVPCLNIGTIYRFKWGNIPNLPVIRPLAEFINLKLLKGKHMTFGYELSFTRNSLINLHKHAGFANVAVGQYKTIILLERIGIPLVRKIFTYLCTNVELFWPMYSVYSTK